MHRKVCTGVPRASFVSITSVTNKGKNASSQYIFNVKLNTRDAYMYTQGTGFPIKRHQG